MCAKRSNHRNSRNRSGASGSGSAPGTSSTGTGAPEYRRHGVNDGDGDSSSSARPGEAELENDNQQEKWQEVADKITFWSTFVETRLLSLGRLMEMLNAETVLAANAVKESASDGVQATAILTRCVCLSDSQLRCESKVEKAKRDVVESEERLSSVAIGLISAGVMTAVTAGLLLKKEL